MTSYTSSDTFLGRRHASVHHPRHDAPAVKPSETWAGLSDRARGIVYSQIEDELRSRDYSASSAQEAATTVSERVMIALREITQDYKIIVNSTVLQKIGAGLHMVNSTYWDGAHDGSTVVRWENASLICIVTVYGVRLE